MSPSAPKKESNYLDSGSGVKEKEKQTATQANKIAVDLG